ncbi:Zinc finger protein-like 1 -like protein [Trichinella zimbabwensis]|uniref:Zinc finger protein-like 1 homolog n=1 Tax=Trichinella zimbabwensis TaxID=268475 RepID=A0A0V1HPY9_9BILA|nr:Zinc finger protein-like 1 -like protein [Trichinella zimbabwensis]
MGLCRCKRKKVTQMFCFEHRVNVCEFCLVEDHSKCIVQTYLSWLNDSDYNDSCYFCFKPLSSGDLETVRLLCLHLFHWDCLDKWALSLPANTAPAGYKCPECGERILPKSNQVSPVVDCLKKKLINAKWAERRCNIKQKPLESNGEVYNLPERMKTVTGCNARASNVVADSVNSSNSSWQKTNDDEDYYQGDLMTTTTTSPSSTKLLIDDNVENKYHRKSGNCTIARNLILRFCPDRSDWNSRACCRRIFLLLLIFLVCLITFYSLSNRSQHYIQEQDPLFDPASNPDIRIGLH